MKVVKVAVPLLRRKNKFYFDKGRPWSIVEQIILHSLAKDSQTSAQVSQSGNLHHRLVIEVIVRLMRAGWVELIQSDKDVLFQASPAGLIAAHADELPAPTKRMHRTMSYVIDHITGTVYRSRDWSLLYPKFRLLELAQREPIVWMQEREIGSGGDVRSILSVLFEDDEKFVGIDTSADRPASRYALVTVRDQEIEGLPSRAPREFADSILKAAKHAPVASSGRDYPNYVVEPQPIKTQPIVVQPRSIAFQTSDILIGGAAHKQVLENAIHKARHRLIIHSTFIRDDAFEEWKPSLIEAVKKGVKVDILWGQNDKATDGRSTFKVASQLREKIAASGFSNVLRVHPFSTRSHAKLLISDEGNPNRLVAVIGSCNWLYSNFTSFEASVRLRDSDIVSDVLYQVAELSRGVERHWTDITDEFARLAVNVRQQPNPGGARANGTLVTGPEHGRFVRQARDEAKNRIVVMSHRLGAASKAFILPPTQAAAIRDLDVKIYYGIVNPEMRDEVPKLISAAAAASVRLQPVYEPTIHAKILAWDDDNLLITSRNWLSADSAESNPLGEIGLYVEARSSARLLMEQFDLMRNYT